MWKPQNLKDGTKTNRALGFMVSGSTVSHGGKQTEATSDMVIVPKDKRGIVVLTNCGYGKPAEIVSAINKALAK